MSNKFPLHCWFPPGTWIINEVMYERSPLVFCLEGNSRYVFVVIPKLVTSRNLEKKTLTSTKLLRAMEKLFEENNGEVNDKTKHVRKIQHIIWDSAAIHKSMEINNALERYKITSQIVNVNRELHGAMHLLDRAVRTFRDLNDTYLKQDYEEEELKDYLPKIILNYNRTPHRSLEEMTYIRGMIRWNVHINNILERQVIKYCQIWNYSVRMKGPYDLEIGDKVLVKIIAPNKLSFKKRSKYHETIYTIVGKEAGRYRLDPEFPDMPLVPRSMLIKIRKKRKAKLWSY